VALICSAAAAEPAAPIASPQTAAPLRITERSDYSRYVDGRYLGHAHREARGTLLPSADARLYQGEFLVLEETLRDMIGVSRKIDASFPASLEFSSRGLETKSDSGYPSLRSCPSFPAGLEPESLEKGQTWTAAGTRALGCDDSGSFILVPFLAEYRFLGSADYHGRRALSLTAQFGTRWPATTGGGSAAGPLKGAAGTHELDILVDALTLVPLFIRDRFDETLSLASGSSERRAGFTLYFYDDAPALDQAEAGKALVAAVDATGISKSPASPPSAAATIPSGPPAPPLAGEGAPAGAGPGPLIAGEAPALDDAFAAAGLELGTSPEGLVLRVKDLRFVADSDEILGSELWRLDAIAAALKALRGRNFLVAGHSAAVGKAEGELELSMLRAKKVTDELVKRGIESSRMLYRGFGSSRPLAGNDTEEGRAKNRRVEITVLE
jgi:outer membrane protein OmpA-like peptidoglycan-associated protein